MKSATRLPIIIRPFLLVVLGVTFASNVMGQFSTSGRPRLENGQPAAAPPRKPIFQLPGILRKRPENPTTDTPHPAIVRVECEGDGTLARGSGTLIGADEQHGYVISNWHVVQAATGAITVKFPDGFESAATVLKTDEEWDLAVLAIWTPPTAPMPLSPKLPEPGDPLIIAGYGQGPFRAVLGQATDYVSPSANAPFEMIEVTAAARQGDSGGPIMNQQGELSGVLFGSGNGRTTGTHVGRVKAFLDSAFSQRPNPNPNVPEQLASSQPTQSHLANQPMGGPLPPPMAPSSSIVGQSNQRPSPNVGPVATGTPLPTSGVDPSLLEPIDIAALIDDIPSLDIPNYPQEFGPSRPTNQFQPVRPTNPLMPFLLIVGGAAALLFLLPRQ